MSDRLLSSQNASFVPVSGRITRSFARSPYIAFGKELTGSQARALAEISGSRSFPDLIPVTLSYDSDSQLTRSTDKLDWLVGD